MAKDQIQSFFCIKFLIKIARKPNHQQKIVSRAVALPFSEQTFLQKRLREERWGKLLFFFSMDFNNCNVGSLRRLSQTSEDRKK